MMHLIDKTLLEIDNGYPPGLIQWIKQSNRWDDLLTLENQINKAALVNNEKGLREELNVYKDFFSKCSTSYPETGFVVQGNLFGTKKQEMNADAKPQPQVRTRSEERSIVMKISKMFPSNYYSKDDVGDPEIVTIMRVDMERIKTEEGEKEKPVAYFTNVDKGMILNKSNGEVLAGAFGDDSTDWEGKTIEIYIDPNIRFGSKRVGGLRLRVPTNTSQENVPF